MNIYPAIDLRDGKVVRLYQGDYDQMTVYQEDPVDVARSFKAAGADYLHLVDLDGAKDGELVNFDTIKAIVEDVDMFVEVGGGIRDEERIKQYLDLGVGRVILGTIAVKDREFLEKMVSVYGERIAVGVDARDGRVAINGWKEITDIDSFEFCEYLRDIGVKAVIYTDISRDGGLQGTNMEVYRKLQEIQGLEITASGGISFIEEIAELKNVTAAAILGKALYSGLIDLAQAVEMAK
ncbi:MAG: 1-(5-phosphoribosyl)-5-[(5-phosphoribosylamino)methylideneamino]imidazole-4-carboxamide isomerase [Firmicutes bacterium]|nr:1-(5-phosphoribosyl)-5-[(5-phosphoribosylamino)methylideneamino]imidazole-4-carboxamide isomerase [Bacillota bacterium]